MKSFFLVVAFLFTFNTWTIAQADTLRPALSLSLTAHIGKLIKIHGEYPDNDISSLTELSMLWKTQVAQPWQRYYHYPSAGISLLHAQFGNQDVLGNAIALIPHMRFERWKKQTRVSWRAGLGIAWFDRPYDAIGNPRNLVIGSSLANMSMIAI